MTDSEALTEARVREIMDGCEGVTPGPWEVGLAGDYPKDSVLDAGHTPIHGPKWGAFASVVTDTTKYGGRVETSEIGKRTLAHIARLDPDTVRVLCTLALSALGTAPAVGAVTIPVALHREGLAAALAETERWGPDADHWSIVQSGIDAYRRALSEATANGK